MINVRDCGAIGDGVTDDTAAIQAALGLCASGGAVWVPSGTYKCSAPLQFKGHNTRLIAEARAYGYNPPSPVVRLSFVGPLPAGISFNAVIGDPTTAWNYCELDGVFIEGNSSLAAGVEVAGLANVIRAIYVRHCTIGINGLDGINSLKMVDNCCASFNGTGLFVTGTNTTTFSVRDLKLRQNGVGLVLYSGQNVEFTSCVIESNTGYGAWVFNNTLALSNQMHLNQISFNQCWFESNGAGNGVTDQYQVVIDGTTPSGYPFYPQFIDFERCLFSLGPSPHRAMHVKAASDVRLHRCNIRGGDAQNYFVLESTALRTTFADLDLLEAVNPQTPAQVMAMGVGTRWI
jgi:hypothetical protein